MTAGPKVSDKLRRLRDASSGVWVNESVPDIEDLSKSFDGNVIPEEFKQWLAKRIGEYRLSVTESEQQLTRRELIEHLSSLSSDIKATTQGLAFIPPETFAQLATSQHKRRSNDFQIFKRVADELIIVRTHVKIVLDKFTEEHDTAGRNNVGARDLLIYLIVDRLRPALVSKLDVARRITHEILTRSGVTVPAIDSMKASAQKGKEIHLKKG